MKKLTMMFALSMAVTVLASDGAVRWIDGEKIVVDGDKYAMNWILECDGKQYDFLEPRFKWGTFHHPKELAGKIEDSFSRRQDGYDLVETLVITNISDGLVNLWGGDRLVAVQRQLPRRKGVREAPLQRASLAVRIGGVGLLHEDGRRSAPSWMDADEGRV